MYGVAALGELVVRPLSEVVPESVSSVRFSTREEALWSGCNGGGLYALQCPSLQRYSSVQLHPQSVQGLAPLTDGIVSVSPTVLYYTAPGGLSRASLAIDQDEVGGEYAAVAGEPGSSGRVVLGRLQAVSSCDVSVGKLVTTALRESGAVVVAAPVGRCLVLAGGADGRVALLDPRAGLKEEHVIAAHTAGLASAHGQTDTVVTCGYALRQGTVIPDPFVKVYDVRMVPRMASSFAFNAGPAMVRFSPKFSTMLLVAAASGVFTCTDVNSNAFNRMYQVECEGDAIVSCDISPSGETVAFGGSGGYIHLWAFNQEPSVNAYFQPLEVPSAPAPATSLAEGDSFTAAPQFFASEGGMLSDWDLGSTGRLKVMRLPPRIVPSELLDKMKVVDFVGHLQNPAMRHDLPLSEGIRLAAPLRNKRLDPGTTSLKGRQAGGAPRMGLEAGALPPRYRKMRQQRQAGARFEQQSMAAHNNTRFAGLENDIANCYANALVQVLYFTPALRGALAGVAPDADIEWSLADEVVLLFRMLDGGAGRACQAANLLRALRQSRQAAALGLLQAGPQAAIQGYDSQVEASKDKSLPRRAQSLQRFLLEHLHREMLQRQLTLGPLAAALPPSAALLGEPAAPDAPTTVVDRVFGMLSRQRLKSVAGDAETLRDSRFFQVDLLYPPSKSRPPLATRGKAPVLPLSASTPRPSFAALLMAALQPESETRAWVSPEAGYQQVLTVGCSLQDKADLAWWQPYSAEQDSLERPWLPWAIEITTNLSSWKVLVREAESSAHLQASALADGDRRAVYELTGMVAYIEEAEGEQVPEGAEPGHLVAHIKVLAPYYDPERGILPSTPMPSSPARFGALGQAVMPPPPPSWAARLPASPSATAAAPSTSQADGSASAADGGETAAGKPTEETRGGQDTAEGGVSCGQPTALPENRAAAASVASAAMSIIVGDADSHISFAGGEGHSTSTPEGPAGSRALQLGVTSPSVAAGLDGADRQLKETGLAPSNAAEEGVSSASSPLHAQDMAAPAGPRTAGGADSLRSAEAAAAKSLVVEGVDTPAESPTAREAQCPAGQQQLQPAAQAQPAEGAAAGRSTGPKLPHTQPALQVPGHMPGLGLTSLLSANIIKLPRPAGGKGDIVTLPTLRLPAVAASPSNFQPNAAGPREPATPAAAPAREAPHKLSLPSSSAIDAAGPCDQPELAGRPVPGSAASTYPQPTQPAEQRSTASAGQHADMCPEPAVAAKPDAAKAEADVSHAASNTSRSAHGDSHGQGQAEESKVSAPGPELHMPPPDAGAAMQWAPAHAAPPQPPEPLPVKHPAAGGGGGLGAVAVRPPLGPIRTGVPRTLSGGWPPTPGSASRLRPPEWLLFNDFAVATTGVEEIRTLYGAQKMPCLLYFTQVEVLEEAAAMEPPVHKAVLSWEDFQRVCTAPPLQGARARLNPPSYVVLGPQEMPRPGTLLALDAEFVAHAPAQTARRGGVEVEVRPPRLGLARVSVLRGEGASAGQAFIDDYICTAEPVFDYLTKYSGLVLGDLDPAMSPHALTTLKRAYLKLRYLVDAGCVFVGHGLSQDFRMINIVVIDTVDLFHFKHQRKLSLRFLASFMLGLDIQSDTHDSIEDARTALRLFRVYEHLVAEGRLHEKLIDMYGWGRVHGWDSVYAGDAMPPGRLVVQRLPQRTP